MSSTILDEGLRIDESLYALVAEEITAGTHIAPKGFWRSIAAIANDLAPRNRALLERRQHFEKRIDTWLRERRGRSVEAAAQEAFLSEIGYLVPEGPDFEIDVDAVDREIAEVAGPQLVVPVQIPRYSLNAANARWGSLYDALYGTDVIPETGGATRGGAYNPVRGERVVSFAKGLLDAWVPLERGSYADVTELALSDVADGRSLRATLSDGNVTGLRDPSQLVGFDGKKSLVLLHNGLHVEIVIDRTHPVGRDDPAGIRDVVLESAVTTIQDFEDSVAAVDAEDKVAVYRNWLGLMRGDLTATFEKGGATVTRGLAPDKAVLSVSGRPVTLPGRSLMLVRNVGLHMFTDAVTTSDGQELPEGVLDAMVSALAATQRRERGSIYIVKPKLHGPEETAFTAELFSRVEEALELPRNTLKIGIMDEERRTTVNLKECIRAARERVIFINTGFLDRTGDEIHTAMEAGPVLPKEDIKRAPWLGAYEDWNVDIGLDTGFSGRAQIGKGMWAMPDEMAAMLESKGEHPRAGASTAWVPSPTAATLHAIHYHEVNVRARQDELRGRARASLRDILTMPLLPASGGGLDDRAIQKELDNNSQGILGYVVRWVGQGIGCSKVPDIHDTALMEDRATLRISSQHVANWLHHGVVSRDRVVATMKRMAAEVDRQNAGDPSYRSMASDYDGSVELRAALELVFRGRDVPNGYTESVLHPMRREAKARLRGA